MAVIIYVKIYLDEGFPGGLDSKEFACSAWDLRLLPGLGRSAGEGNGNPLQDSCLENFLVRGACGATVHRVAKSLTWLSDQQFHFLYLDEDLNCFLKNTFSLNNG